ncbi:39S ribosomal protein L42, mitochondrial [Dendroctonus ponderosae]
MSLKLLSCKSLGGLVGRSFSSQRKIVSTSDGSTLVAWHPKQDFPYECTRPLPQQTTEEDASVLKTKLTPELLSIFNKKTPEQARAELMSITHTTKHRWFPLARRKRWRKTSPDREYL